MILVELIKKILTFDLVLDNFRLSFLMYFSQILEDFQQILEKELNCI